MAKKAKKTKATLEEIIQKDIEIQQATMRDDLCNYTFKVLQGIGKKDVHNVKGANIVKPELQEAFQRMNVHLAVIDDVFKNNHIEIDNIDNLHNHALTALYHVNGFKIKGSKENEAIILMGVKFVGAGNGRIEFETPPQYLGKLSGYNWYNELKECADTVREEVEKYKNGNYTEIEEEVVVDEQQLTIAAMMDDDKSSEFVNAEIN